VNKLKLHLDELAVESFDTSGVDKEEGTVMAEQCSCNGTCPVTACATCPNTCAYTCDDATCPACPTCAASCNGTCAGATCYDTCGASCWDTCRPRDCIDYQQ
jgi:hypothetical protein